MKTFKLLAVVCIFCGVSSIANAQDCHKLVSPLFSSEAYNGMPQEKIDYYCRFARSAFYMTSTLPKDAIVYKITEVSDKKTNEKLLSAVKIDLNTFSYYAYDFDKFQYRHYYNEVYFETSNSNNKYLVLRSYDEIINRVNDYNK